MSPGGLARRLDDAGRRRKICFAGALLCILGLAAAAASLWVAPGPRGVLGALLALVMLAIAVIDARHFIIPDELSAAALALALANAAIEGRRRRWPASRSRSLRGAALALLPGLARRLPRIRGRQGIGLGDVKLAGVAGAWLDWATIPIAIEIAALTALAAVAIRHSRAAARCARPRGCRSACSWRRRSGSAGCSTRPCSPVEYRARPAPRA